MCLLQRASGLSSSFPLPLSKLARPPSSLLVQAATPARETTPNAAGLPWVLVSSGPSVGALEQVQEARVEALCVGEDVARKAVEVLKM